MNAVRGHAIALGLFATAGAAAWLLTGGPPEAATVFQAPASPERWCDLGDSLTGNLPLARYAFTRAVALGPHFPPGLFRSASFFIRTGDRGRALPLLTRLLLIAPEYDYLVFGTLDRLGVPPSSVFPPDRRSAQSWLRYLVSRNSLDPARAVWQSILGRSLADDRLASDYVAFLLRQKRFEEAVQSWVAYLGPRRGPYRRTNYLFNPDFETDPTGSPFDWRIESLPSVEITRESHGLSLRFDGTQNIDFHHVSQQSFLPPATWRFQAQVRTESLTTDEGFRLEASGAVTEPVTGDTPWQTVSLRFTVPPPGRLVDVRLIRRPSMKFDNKISGRVWIRALMLEPAP